MPHLASARCPAASQACAACAAGADVENNITVAISSDKGLCGGINSTVSKYTRAVVKSVESGERLPPSAKRTGASQTGIKISSQLGPWELCALLGLSHLSMPKCPCCQVCAAPAAPGSCSTSSTGWARREAAAHTVPAGLLSRAKSAGWGAAEGRKSNIVVVGEKARAQLVRDRREKIVATVQDVNKLRITYAQVGTAVRVPNACPRAPSMQGASPCKVCFALWVFAAPLHTRRLQQTTWLSCSCRHLLWQRSC